MEKNKWLVAILAGVLGTISNQYAVIFIFVIVAIILDVITGIVKAMATDEGLSSEKGHKGFWKKVSFLSHWCLVVILIILFLLCYRISE